MTSTLRNYLSIAALVALPVLHGCGNSSSTSSSSIRLVNATTDYPSLDLYWSTTAVSTDAKSFFAGSYGGADAGTQTLTLRPAGTSTVISSAGYTLTGGTSYSVVAYIDTGSQLKGALLTDSETAPSSGAAKFRIFNTISNTPTGSTTTNDLLDAYVTQTACSALAASHVSATPPSGVKALGTYTEVTASAAGTPYNVCITGNGDPNDLRLALSGVTLKDQQITTLVLTPTPGGVLVNGVQVDQNSSVTARANASARVRVAADAAGGAPVTVKVATAGGATSNLASSALSPTVGTYQVVPAGSLTPTVQIGGSTIAASSFTTAPGADYTLLVAGNSTVAWLPDSNRPSTVPAKPVKLRLVNGLNGFSGAITLQDNFDTAASNVLFGAASTPYYLAPASTATVVQVILPGTPPQTLTIPGDNVTLAAGKVYTAFVLGDATAPIFRLVADH